MNLTHQLLTRETIECKVDAETVAAYLKRVQQASIDPDISIEQMIELIYHPDNPILDSTIVPGRGMVTPATLKTPIYRVMSDLLSRKEIQKGKLNMDAVKAAHTVSVQDAAEQLGITPAAIRAAINARRLVGMIINGQWWIRPESVASYRVSNRGPKRKTEASTSTSGSSVITRLGSDDGISLSVRVLNGEVIAEGKKGWGRLSDGWTAALIRTTSKSGVRTFEIEPNNESIETIEHGKLFVRGPFRIVKKYTTTATAVEAWKASQPGVGSE